MFRIFGAAKALSSFVRLVRDPRGLDEVFVISDALADPSIGAPIIEAIRQQPAAPAAFAERPRIGRIDIRALAQLPEGTLGRAYADLMQGNELDPGDLPTIEAKDDFDYVRAHLYETHDIWHVVTGFDTDVAGELGLQGFYYAQIPSPLSTVLIAAGMLNTAIRGFGEHDVRMREIVRGWLMGRRATPLFGTRWAEQWERPLADIRAELKIDPRGAEAWMPPPAEHGTVDVRFVPAF